MEKRFSIDFNGRISQHRIGEPEVPMTSSIWRGSVPDFYAVRTHYRLSRSDLLLKSRIAHCRNRKTDFHRVAWRALLSPDWKRRVDGVIGMAALGARILAGLNAV